MVINILCILNVQKVTHHEGMRNHEPQDQEYHELIMITKTWDKNHCTYILYFKCYETRVPWICHACNEKERKITRFKVFEPCLAQLTSIDSQKKKEKSI